LIALARARAPLVAVGGAGGVCLALLIPSYLFYWMFLAAGMAVLATHSALLGQRSRAVIVAPRSRRTRTRRAVLDPYPTFKRCRGDRDMLRFGLEPGRAWFLPSLKEIALLAVLAVACGSSAARASGSCSRSASADPVPQRAARDGYTVQPATGAIAWW